MKTLEERLRQRYADYLAQGCHPCPLSYEDWCRQSRAAAQIRLTHSSPKSNDVGGVQYKSPIGRRSEWN